MMSFTNKRRNSSTQKSPSVYPYKKLWFLLLGGWLFAYADRALTGPVVTWMIDNKVAFLSAADNPYALGGLIGSMFFAGYMLTQLPSGRLGDKFGHGALLVISFVWAGVATLITGAVTGLLVFVGARVITGLGEGAFYSNDRAIIVKNTPQPKRSLGLGVAITGLAFGLTAANITAVPLIELGTNVLSKEHAWRVPFLLFGCLTLIFSIFLTIFMRRHSWSKRGNAWRAFRSLLGTSILLAVALVFFFWLADSLGFPEWVSALIEIALGLTIAFTMMRRHGSAISTTLKNRNTLLIFLGAISIMWSIWLFGYWSVSIVSTAAHSSLAQAGMVAAFNAGAGLIGFPIGGWLSDKALQHGMGRRLPLIIATVLQGTSVVAFAVYLQWAGDPAPWAMSVLLFITGLFLNAVQPMSQGLTSDLVDADSQGTAFGMWNLIAEIGAVASPVVSGALRDATGSWQPALYLDAFLVFAAALLYLGVREKKGNVSAVPLEEATEQ